MRPLFQNSSNNISNRSIHRGAGNCGYGCHIVNSPLVRGMLSYKFDCFHIIRIPQSKKGVTSGPNPWGEESLSDISVAILAQEYDPALCLSFCGPVNVA